MLTQDDKAYYLGITIQVFTQICTQKFSLTKDPKGLCEKILKAAKVDGLDEGVVCNSLGLKRSNAKAALSPAEEKLLRGLAKEKDFPLLIPGGFTDESGKNYGYRIASDCGSVKGFVAELKKRGKTDDHSRKIIYEKVLLPTKLNARTYKQVSWETFRKYFY